jgi:hypothetical protein
VAGKLTQENKMNEIDLQLKPVNQPSTEADKLEAELENDIPEKFRGKSVKDVKLG